MSHHIALGVDIGGTGIKAAPVNLKTGEFAADRYRVLTPQPATPDSVGKAVAQVVAKFEPTKKTPIGITFPGVIQHSVVRFAPNMDPSWVGVNIDDVMRDYIGREVHTINDADAAGFGEYLYGAAHGRDGVVFLATLGTGIGTALIVDGEVMPNTELGHLIVDGLDAEEYSAESARERHGLDWDQWAKHLQKYFSEIERLLWPDLIIVGGGVSKAHDMFLPKLTLRTPIVPAELLNGAGIVGAAAGAAHAKERADAAKKKASAKSSKGASKKF
ncbi:polyphosphate--glucose phosphotransferase [Demequina lutea]|uniref:Polyphosphate glucokinase n=1 Tax=Demequina lutea TaxID=431489 RepID=A0A7Y9Z985_9MICO|nr:ROK family protein [Demequina lutea]NYI41169.1 polyphosphate glucokinase [Demequina lutea]